LNNEWVVFGGIFLITFAVVYLALFNAFLQSKKPKGIQDYLYPPKVAGNQGPVIVISLVIALFVAGAMSQRTYFYSYIGESMGSWIIFIAAILITLLTIRAGFKMPRVGSLVGMVLLFGLWMMLRSINPYSILPYNAAYEIEQLYYFLGSLPALIIIILTGAGVVGWHQMHR